MECKGDAGLSRIRECRAGLTGRLAVRYARWRARRQLRRHHADLSSRLHGPRRRARADSARRLPGAGPDRARDAVDGRDHQRRGVLLHFPALRGRSRSCRRRKSTGGWSPSISTKAAGSSGSPITASRTASIFDFVSRTTPSGGVNRTISPSSSRSRSSKAVLNIHAVIPGRRASGEPGTRQNRHPHRSLDSGFARGRAPRNDRRSSAQRASTASSSSATMLVILIIGLTAGPAVSL